MRFRTVGDISCTCPVASTAANPVDIIAETAVTEITERGATRMDDQTTEASMERARRKATSKHAAKDHTRRLDKHRRPGPAALYHRGFRGRRQEHADRPPAV